MDVNGFIRKMKKFEQTVRTSELTENFGCTVEQEELSELEVQVARDDMIQYMMTIVRQAKSDGRMQALKEEIVRLQGALKYFKR